MRVIGGGQGHDRRVPAVDGLLVMADISGYTAFVSGTEPERSREILAELRSPPSRMSVRRVAVARKR